MKQKVFSFRDEFTIKDEVGNDRYYVEGEFLSLGHKLYIYDESRNEVAFVKQKLMTFLPKFEVYLGDNMVVEVLKELSFFKSKYTINGVNWTVDGDFWAHEYTISDGMNEIVSINKAWFTWGDSYEINVAEGVNEVLAIATVLAIDCVLEAASHSAN